MQSLKTLFSTLFSVLALSFFTLNGTAHAKQENNDLMTFAILGAVGSLGLACYEGKPPCSLKPGVDWSKRTFSLDAGADMTTKHSRISIAADWLEPVYQATNWEVTGRLETSLHHWYSTLSQQNNESGIIWGIAPVFHYQLRDYSIANTGLQPFFEMGGGPHILDNITIENEYKSTQFQFGSIFGFGVKNKRFEITYRYLHISNAGIEMPNPGTDFHDAHIGIYF